MISIRLLEKRSCWFDMADRAVGAVVFLSMKPYLASGLPFADVQVDHTVRFNEGNITLVGTADIIGDDILPSARRWNQHINLINGFPLGLLICDVTNISCNDHRGNNLNRDTTQVTIMTSAPTSATDNLTGCGPDYACVIHPDVSDNADDDPGVGAHMTNMDMIFENPAYTCSTVHLVTGNPEPVCDTNEHVKYTGTNNASEHGTPVLNDNSTYVYIRYIMLHEFGHTLGLPDFNSGGGQTNYDPNLAGETAIMNLPWNAVNISPSDRYQLDAIYRTHTRH